MSITIKEIAQLAGVSRGTVDRALNGRRGIKPDVAEKILQIAQEHQYQPNLVGKVLSQTKKEYRIAAIINGTRNPFFDDVLRGIAAFEKKRADFHLNVSIEVLPDYQLSTQIAALKSYLNQPIDGLILTAIEHDSIRELLRQFDKQGITVVTCNMDISDAPRLCYVGCDYEKSGAIAAGMMALITNEQAQIGVVVGSRNVWGHMQREQGFVRTLAIEHPEIQIVRIVEGLDDDLRCENLVNQMLYEFPFLDGLCFLTSGIQGGVRALEQQHRRNIRVLSFERGAVSESYLQNGKVQVVLCQNPFEQGYQAINILFDYLLLGKKPESDFYCTPIDIVIKQTL